MARPPRQPTIPSGKAEVEIDERRKPAATATVEPPPAKRSVPGRPKSPTEAVAKAIYFRDRRMIEELESILANHERSSLSGVIQQLLGSFIAEYKRQPPIDNKMTVTASVYL